MISETDPAPHFKTFRVFLIGVGSVQVSAPYKTVLQM